MQYISTRDSSVRVCAAQAIAQGISREGGLFVPESIPKLSKEDFEQLQKMDYIGRAKTVLGLYLTDFTAEEIDRCVRGAYSGTFDADKPAPLRQLRDGVWMLELWHGPTCAFKDLALQLLPHLLTTSVAKVAKGQKTVILVATSGDTGKAALEGFKDVENTEIIVFYPEDGVSPMQKLQMDTQDGENVLVCAIAGNFDDAQSGVKAIFTDEKMRQQLSDKNMQFSSANSINWGRLVPQIVYYVSAYCDLLERGENLQSGFNVVVPTGNFGNILAAYYAKEMGVPIARLICASNANHVLTDFISTGIYDRNRPFYTTLSPSMDILISSNLERMLFELCGRDDKTVAGWQADLANSGRFQVSDEVLKGLQALFSGGSCDDEGTKQTIRDVFAATNYLSDTHTAVALSVYEAYRKNTQDTVPAVIASTASPYKFAASVLEALGLKVPADPFEALEKLSSVSGTPVPAPIEALKGKTPRFSNRIQGQEMREFVLKHLGVH